MQFLFPVPANEALFSASGDRRRLGNANSATETYPVNSLTVRQKFTTFRTCSICQQVQVLWVQAGFVLGGHGLDRQFSSPRPRRRRCSLAVPDNIRQTGGPEVKKLAPGKLNIRTRPLKKSSQAADRSTALAPARNEIFFDAKLVQNPPDNKIDQVGNRFRVMIKPRHGRRVRFRPRPKDASCFHIAIGPRGVSRGTTINFRRSFKCTSACALDEIGRKPVGNARQRPHRTGANHHAGCQERSAGDRCRIIPVVVIKRVFPPPFPRGPPAGRAERGRSSRDRSRSPAPFQAPEPPPG